MTAGAIPTDTPHFSSESLQSGVLISETAGLDGAARRVVFWVEKQHQGFTAEISQAALHPVLIFGFELRSLIANSDGHRTNP